MADMDRTTPAPPVVIINPGSGPVAGATEQHAEASMVEFARDVLRAHGYDEIGYARRPAADEDGRFGYRLTCVKAGQESTFEIDMPGLPLERVRWLDEPEQNIWHFPRLYVDGNSWVWKFAVGVCEPAGDESAEDGS